jgi:ribosomal protein S18 acetylase RimI-like enzyme
MNAGEVGLIRSWADAEQWNPGIHDGPVLFAADPEGYFVGELAGKQVGCISCVRYGDDFGFLGQYIVRPECRGLGFGISIWNAGMAHLAGRNVGLDGVLAQVKNYERSGFHFAHHHVRYMGTGGGTRPRGLMPVDVISFQTLAEYDDRCFPAARHEFVHEWIRLPDAIALAAKSGAELTGYGVIRRSTVGFKVGPLFADDTDTAVRLLGGLIAAIPGEPFCIDMPEPIVQTGTQELVSSFALSEVFRTARMYTGGEPAFNKSRVFGITTLELG